METLFIGRNVIRLKKVVSTNTFAAAMLKETNTPDGTVVIANEQAQGRGQRGSGWESEAGMNLLCSIVLFPHFIKAGEQFNLNMAISLAVRDTISSLIPTKEVKIKWPNDILLNGKKVSGILIENSLKGEEIQSSVVGVGININQKNFTSLPSATSMVLETQNEHSIEKVLECLCNNLEARYLQLRARDQKYKEEYLKGLYLIDQPAIFERDGKTFPGIISGISSQGKLLVKDEDGVKEYGIKEIKFA